MRFRTLGGGRGPEVSALCLGTLPFGTTVDEETSYAILDRFAEAGGTFLDTADNYACWVPGATGDESELLLGRWLRSRGARDRTVLATKVGARPDPSRGPEWPANLEGLGEKAVRDGIEGSLRRLGTDRVDLYYAHIEDRSVPLEETVGALAGLVRDGSVGLLGASNHATWRLAEARRIAEAQGLPGYRAVQQRHTYLRPRPDADSGLQRETDGELVDYAEAHEDVTLLGYSTLMHGGYARPEQPLPDRYDHPGSVARLRVLREVAAEAGATVNQVVLAWLMDGRVPVVPVLGVSSVAQLDESLAALDLRLDAAQRARLDTA
ncbi:oxidoreductase [Streptomyces sp. NRRL F-5755]|uniref:aldo/keto reductase n=1 Tax=Streptomyces sp. NRRL F-5755 TaxID=1519475 RepID=UPI0006ADD35B|nr:aldo/keto reductase [Streptomyces sp. NRRL F-5755]KOT86196.1 oxidoreductase [Streptomyces sp. NRRL F-5755]